MRAERAKISNFRELSTTNCTVESHLLFISDDRITNAIHVRPRLRVNGSLLSYQALHNEQETTELLALLPFAAVGVGSNLRVMTIQPGYIVETRAKPVRTGRVKSAVKNKRHTW